MESVSELSDGQEIVLSVLQVVSASLSLIGSSTIVYKIVRKLERCKTTAPYDRIMLGLSGCDILASITYAAAPFLLPKSTSQRVWAMGTDWTCSRLGFLTQLACLWAVWYNALLSFYFLLTVRFQVKPDVFRRRYEPWMHLSGAIFFPVTAIVGLAGDWYSEEKLTMMCWIGEVPGGHGFLVAALFGGIPTAITLLSLIINNIVIYAFVRKSLLLPSQAATATTTTTEANDPETTTKTTETKNRESSEIDVEENTESQSNDRSQSLEERLTREIAIQGLLYVTSFILTITPGFILSFLEGVGFTEAQIKGGSTRCWC